MKTEEPTERQPQVATSAVVCDGKPETMTDAQAQELADWMDKLASECTCIRDDRPCEGLMAGGLCDDCNHSDWEEDSPERSHTDKALPQGGAKKGNEYE